MSHIEKLINEFVQWYKGDKHHDLEDAYSELQTSAYLEGLNQDDFSSFFVKFVKDGGGVQSGGQRAIGGLKKMLNSNYTAFRQYVLLPYKKDFDAENWIKNLSKFSSFGMGAASIYLNRINKDRFPIVNDKSQKALTILGYSIPKNKDKAYAPTLKAQQNLQKRFPIIKNFYVADSLNDFLVGNSNAQEMLDATDLLIEKYKNHIRENGLEDEVYKWNLLEQYKGRVDADAEDFEKEIKTVDYNNLIYAMSKSVLNKITKTKAEELRGLFKMLFDESIDLKDRIKSFNVETLRLYKEVEGQHSHHQDERSMAAYLAIKYPEKYTFYKSSYYEKYCSHIGVQSKGKNEKYVHYLSLIKILCEQYIEEDKELIQLIKAIIPNYYDGKRHNMIAQDILYQTLDKMETQYWVFQGNPQEFDVERGLREALTDSWKVTAHKNEIKKGDKVILYVTGKEAGCYALAEVTSDVYEERPQRDDKLWRKGSKGEYGVDIEFTYNLLDHPILKDELKSNKSLAKLKIGTQGTNFAATEVQYHTILDMIDEANHQDEIHDTMKQTISYPLNQILYGPPGTGKTYELSSRYFADYTSTKASVSKEEFIKSKIEDKSWWEVIALVILELGICKVSDIYEHKLLQLKSSLSNSNNVRSTIWGQLQIHTVDSCENVNYSKKGSPLIFNKTDDKKWQIVEEELNEQCPDLLDLHAQITNFSPGSDIEIKRYEFVTFHQSFAYEDFIEGIKPDLSNDNGELNYIIEDGVFKKMCAKARNDSDNNYAIFIDEINRGNVSQIFGELITLIEEDKRAGQANELSVTLPYSKEVFNVPNNLHIIGTMNTADRSVEALDTALRRRFQFVEMSPRPEVIEEVNGQRDLEGIDLVNLLETINRRIEVLLDRDHCIGHSYFLNLKDLDALKVALAKQIIPLLQEYFYGDYGKIALVLGEGFCKAKEQIDTSKLFAQVGDYDAEAYAEKKIYTLNNPIDMDMNEFNKAINTLLNIVSNGE